MDKATEFRESQCEDYMRHRNPDALRELKRRVAELEQSAKPGDDATGMGRPGSLSRFDAALGMTDILTADELGDDLYHWWIKIQYEKVYEKINGESIDAGTVDDFDPPRIERIERDVAKLEAAMRPDALRELKRRVAELERRAKPDDIETGMSGSLANFRGALDITEVLTADEIFDSAIYNDWIALNFERVFEKINGEPINVDEGFTGAMRADMPGLAGMSGVIYEGPPHVTSARDWPLAMPNPYDQHHGPGRHSAAAAPKSRKSIKMKRKKERANRRRARR